jgi:hypothetical protein
LGFSQVLHFIQLFSALSPPPLGNKSPLRR